MSYLTFPTDDEILNFLSNAKFEPKIQHTLDDVGMFNLIKSMRQEEEIIYQLYGFKLLVVLKNNTGKISVIGNVFPVNTHTIELYSFYEENLSTYDFAKYGKLYIDMVKQVPVKRIQVTVLYDNLRACNWYKKLGFAKEGLMKKYDGENDYWLYAFIKD